MAHYFKLGIFEDASSMYDVVYETDPWRDAKMSIDKIISEVSAADVWCSYLPPVPPPRVDYDTKSHMKVDYLGEIQHLRELLKAGQHLCTIQNDTIAMLCARLDSMQEGFLYLWQGMWQPMVPNTQYIIIENKSQASLEKDGQDDALPKSQALESPAAVDFVRAFPGITSMKKYCFRRQDSKFTRLSGEPRSGSSHSASFGNSTSSETKAHPITYYAVRGGTCPGVYDSWDTAKRYCQGDRNIGSLCKKFQDRTSAIEFANVFRNAYASDASDYTEDYEEDEDISVVSGMSFE